MRLMIVDQAIDCGDKKITVNGVAPGAIKTDMFKAVVRDYIPGGDKLTEQEIDEVRATLPNDTPLLLTGRPTKRTAWISPLSRAGLPEDIARVVCFLVSDAAGWITGKTIGIDGGAYR